jgi:AmmeMemoRadiSam system protein B
LGKRPPAVAGSFYPSDPRQLSSSVEQLMAEASSTLTQLPKAFIVPHAGYIYSGPTAAHVYLVLRMLGQRLRRVVLLGPSHFVYFKGIAGTSDTSFVTPLGEVAVEQVPQDVKLLISPEAHADEHSLEVQLPFLQRSLENFRIVPLLVGDTGPADVANLLHRLWDLDETLILISSDLSHYLQYDAAVRTDRDTVRRICALEPLETDSACGARPINGFLRVARERKLRAHLLDARNSGDTSGSRQRVVGYAAVAFYEVS